MVMATAEQGRKPIAELHHRMFESMRVIMAVAAMRRMYCYSSELDEGL